MSSPVSGSADEGAVTQQAVGDRLCDGVHEAVAQVAELGREALGTAAWRAWAPDGLLAFFTGLSQRKKTCALTCSGFSLRTAATARWKARSQSRAMRRAGHHELVVALLAAHAVGAREVIDDRLHLALRSVDRLGHVGHASWRLSGK